MNPQIPDEIEELLAGRVLGDLSPEEESTLDSYLQDNQHAVEDLGELEAVAAAVSLAVEQADEQLPAELKSRILQDATSYIQAASQPVQVREVERLVEPTRPEPKTGSTRRENLAWFVAAACLALALLGWSRFGDSSSVQPAVDLVALRMELKNTPDALSIDWAEGKTPFEKSVAGDVVWSNERQMGVMRFVDMPVNDPSVEQYQLWIIDPERDEEPIDGGVFDVTESGEVLVAVDPKLKVLSPAAFAITVEKPGGVVVSTQDRLPLLAMVE